MATPVTPVTPALRPGPPTITRQAPPKAPSIQKLPPKEVQNSQNEVKGKRIPKWMNSDTGSQALVYSLLLNIGAGLFPALYLYLAAGVVASTAANKIGS